MREGHTNSADLTPRESTPGSVVGAWPVAPAHPPAAAVEARPSLAEFLQLLFWALEQEKIQYCVLRGWERLPKELEHDRDLDLAIHPHDAKKLPMLLRTMSERGYQPIQRLNYAVNACAFVFAWFEDLAPKTVMVDFAFDHRESGFIWRSGEALVAGRQKLDGLWVAEPATEFAYLLINEVSKGTVTPGEEQRFRLLVEILGRPRAEKIASELFGKGQGEEVVQACQDLRLGEMVARLKPALLRRNILRRPLNAVRYVLGDALRLVRCWLQPTGLSFALLGPDGVGKSTLVTGLIEVFGPAFKRHHIFHWRPGVVVPIRDGNGALASPHDEPPRGAAVSVVYLFGFFLDFWLGHVLRIRPLLARSGLVVFDRYFHDLLVDQKRYRYAGPMWLVRLLLRFLPGRDGLLFILDAPEEVILSRKRQVSAEELRRQRGDYRRLSRGSINTYLLETQYGTRQTLAAASRIVSAHLARRLSLSTFPAWPWCRPHLGSCLVNRALLEAIAQFVGRPNRGVTGGQDGLPFRSNPAESAVVSSDRPKSVTRQLAGQGFIRTHRFVVLPSPSEPRWLLPLGDARRTREGFRIYTPYAPIARMLKNLAVGVIGAGWTGRRSNRVLVASKEPLPLEVMVGEVTGERQPAFALSLGTPSHFRKLTVQVMRPGGEILGYIKLPLTEAASERVRHEAAVLERLWNLPALRPHLPRVLHAGEWENGYVLFQSCGPSRPGQVEFGPAHGEFLRTLWSAKPARKPGQALVEEVSTLWRQAASRLDDQWQELGEETLRRASRELSGLTIPCGIMHGDFAPWNTRAENGHLFVFDWEAADWEAPILWDVFHFHLQVASLLNRKSKKGSPLHQAPGEKATFWLYLLRSVCQGLEEESPGHFGVEYRRQVLLHEIHQE